MRWLLAGVALIVVAQVGLALRHRRDPAALPPRPMLTPARPGRAAAAPVRAPALDSSRSSGDLAVSPAAPAVEAFKRKYGTSLELAFSPSGSLSAARGDGSGATAASFDPRDPQAVSRRALEIAHDLKPLLGLDPDSELGHPVVRGSATLAQAEFRQSVRGIPLAPVGGLSMDLGPQGEILGIYAQTWSGVTIENSRILDSARARSALDGRWEGGRPVLYTTAGAREGFGSGRHAFEFYSRSERVVLDASDGRVLERRDIRHFSVKAGSS